RAPDARKRLSYIQREIGILKYHGSPHVVKFVNSFINSDNTTDGYEVCARWKQCTQVPFRGWMVVVMELVEGHDLGCYSAMRSCSHSKARRGCKRTDGDQVPHLMSIMEQVLKGLDTLHKNHVIHRDIKPENIMLGAPNEDGTPTVKLIDLGLSRPLVERNSLLLSHDISSTLYRAPEMVAHNAKGELDFESGEYRFKVDVWAAGITFTQLITPECVLLRDGAVTKKRLLVKLKGCRETVSQLLESDIPNIPGLADLINSMLERDEKKRPTCAMLLKDLAEVKRKYIAATNAAVSAKWTEIQELNQTYTATVGYGI
ncbi:hypothetical protein KIPB_008595, partial [Kipferlia bialata]